MTTVSANVPSPVIPNHPEILARGDETPAEEGTTASMVTDSGGPIQPTTPEPLLPSPDPLSIETSTPMPDRQEMSPTEKARIALRRADKVKKPIDGANTWKRAIRRIKRVMDTVSPIAGVRAISVFPFLN